MLFCRCSNIVKLHVETIWFCNIKLGFSLFKLDKVHNHFRTFSFTKITIFQSNFCSYLCALWQTFSPNLTPRTFVLFKLWSNQWIDIFYIFTTFKHNSQPPRQIHKSGMLKMKISTFLWERWINIKHILDMHVIWQWQLGKKLVHRM